MGEMIVAHDIRHGLKANQQVRTDGLRRMDTPSLTAVLVILTGIFGALIVTPFMNVMRIKDYAARGFAVGLTSHGIGTARAYEVNVTAGLFAGIAMALNAVATSVLAPFAARYLLP